MPQIEIPYKPQPRQLKAHLSKANEIFYGGAAGGGKALALWTRIPTPSGWTTMGEVRVGDEVFASDGSVTCVVAVSDLQYEDTYRLTFSDGSTVVAGGRHEWVTTTVAERTRAHKQTDTYRARRRQTRESRGTGEKPWLAALNSQNAAIRDLPLEGIRTTAEIAKTLKVGGRVNHAVDVAQAVIKADSVLLVDPYVLGAWLGDGTSRTGQITGHDDEVFDSCRDAGYEVSVAGEVRTVYGLVTQLRTLGVYRNKHIPAAYLRGSLRQRVALLQGLMDTDGYCDARGQCEFTNTNKRLIDGFHELLASLGVKASVSEGVATLDGRAIGQKWRIKFLTSLPAFRLPRKAERQKRSGFRGTHDRRYIVSVEQVLAEPLKCLQVAHESHCYLVTEAFIPTHNSVLLRWDLVDFCVHCPNLRAVLFRRTGPQLKANHIDFLTRELPSEIAVWNESHREFRFFNGSILVFRHMEDQRAKDDIQGWEIHVAGIDEAALFEPDQLTFIRSRMRLGSYRDQLVKAAEKNPRINQYLHRLPRMVLTSNPGGPSHLYLKNNYILPAPPETEFVDEYGISKIFIPASMADNRFLDNNYPAQFAEMPEYLRRQLVEGDWDVIPGAYFDCFSTVEHVVSAFQIPAHWTRFRSIDWGYALPCSVGWWAIADDSVVTAKDGTTYQFTPGTMIRYRELYIAKQGRNGPVNEGVRMEARQVARRILDLEAGEDIAYGVADPSMWRSDGGISVAEQMAEEGVFWQKAANERAMGAVQMYARIASGKLYVFDTCINFIRIVPTMVADEKKPEEYKKAGADHLCFRAGTLVDTIDGPLPIESLSNGFVWTLAGWQPFTAGKTGENQGLVRVTLADGRTIDCTPDHLFMTEKGWISAIDLMDETCYEYPSFNGGYSWLQSFLTRSRSFLASGTTFAGTTSRETANGYIGQSGSTLTETSPRDSTSTTRTKTAATTTLTILNFCLGAITSLCTWGLRIVRQAQEKALRLLRLPLPSGTVARLAYAGTANSITSTVYQRCSPQESTETARYAGRNSSQGKAQSSAGITARRVRCVDVEPLKETADVYCLTVPSTGHFTVAGGLVVHNCDEVRYACMSRPQTTEAPVRKMGMSLPTMNDVFKTQAPGNWI